MHSGTTQVHCIIQGVFPCTRYATCSSGGNHIIIQRDAVVKYAESGAQRTTDDLKNFSWGLAAVFPDSNAVVAYKFIRQETTSLI